MKFCTAQEFGTLSQILLDELTAGEEVVVTKNGRPVALMIGIEVRDGYANKDIANRLIENGLLVLTAGPGMRLLPPLVISKEEMDRGVAIMRETLG